MNTKEMTRSVMSPLNHSIVPPIGNIRVSEEESTCRDGGDARLGSQIFGNPVHHEGGYQDDQSGVLRGIAFGKVHVPK
mgnify:CR=1 FL=1